MLNSSSYSRAHYLESDYLWSCRSYSFRLNKVIITNPIEIRINTGFTQGRCGQFFLCRRLVQVASFLRFATHFLEVKKNSISGIWTTHFKHPNMHVVYLVHFYTFSHEEVHIEQRLNHLLTAFPIVFTQCFVVSSSVFWKLLDRRECHHWASARRNLQLDTRRRQERQRKKGPASRKKAKENAVEAVRARSVLDFAVTPL